MTARREDDEIEVLLADVGARVRALREARGWSQAHLAELIGLATEATSRLERGHSVPTLRTLLKACRALEVSPEDLLGWSGSTAASVHQRERVRCLGDALSELPDEGLDVVEALVAFARRK